MMQIPREAEAVVNALAQDGHAAYLVGGCVRDMLLGAAPNDWDVTTSATPDMVRRVFEGHRIIETGAKHGTITVKSGDMLIEVTTFRADGAYSDNRRPDSVSFVRDVEDDLVRRDFTINAMACGLSGEIIDVSGGLRDLADGLIRCVGRPETRFGEDALRIVRAMRFASRLGFRIEPDTSKAMARCRALLRSVASERLSAELGGLIMGKGAADVLRENAPVAEMVIPEITDMIGFEQHNRYHDKTVWEHTLAALDAAPLDLDVRLAILLHDIAKPRCYTNVNGIGRFHGHPARGAAMAGEILCRLRFSGARVRAVTQLVYHHDDRLRADEAALKRWLGALGEAQLRRLIAVQFADARGHSPYGRDDRLRELGRVQETVCKLAALKPCVTVKGLAVNGRDLIRAGMKQGPAIGDALQKLLGLVIDGAVQNERGELLGRLGLE
ncbi:MAG: HD domain-containing protein [Oscillospiraceae bacterium]|jgi:tRNA nucleotidyltransferase (CCA-adding enzyme)|nr:HD domain-containing protein [Oscillospiraceae bacterium]